ncbi:MAG: DUF4932 domain-containing protein, partial [Candidatus Delongbacteria bacterium]|nr:DUF4932 domain-containing protein [Candidatus Delongbacteria bacterium]
VYALYLKNASDSDMICYPCNFPEYEKLNGYNCILKEFYAKAGIETLWNQCRDRMVSLNLEYKPFADSAIHHITSYCRVDPNFYQKKVSGRFHFQLIPLMSYFTAFFYETAQDYWIISGPSTGQPGPGGFYHESLHRIVNPIVERNQKLNKRIDDLVALSQEKLQGSYYGSYALICESLVRTIDKILSARYSQSDDQELYRMVEDEYKLGHILCFYFFENLPAYEKSGKSLKDYYPKLIAGIDIEAEKDRWTRFWKK